MSVAQARMTGGFWRLPLVAILAFTLSVGGYWYHYVTAATEPYDEVGIDLNNAMPGPLHAFGCAKLRARFAPQIPPYGCADATGMHWRS